MSITYGLIGIVTLAIGIYLVWALFRPEDFE
jgi:K+-transporting ATPase KdpF subunit